MQSMPDNFRNTSNLIFFCIHVIQKCACGVRTTLHAAKTNNFLPKKITERVIRLLCCNNMLMKPNNLL